MARNELLRARDVLDDELRDPAMRRRWEELALARAVAIWLIGYRADSGLSQTELAGRLGLNQSVVARLEAAEHVPKLETLLRLAEVLGMSLRLDIIPPSAEPTPELPEGATVEHATTPRGARLRVVAA